MDDYYDEAEQPAFKSWGLKQVYDYAEFAAQDYSSFEKLDVAMSAARRGLFKLTDQINKYEREALAAKKLYDRTVRREYLASVGKTDSERKTRAELKCEALENEWLVKDQLKEELVRASYTLKKEIDTLQVIAHNLRQQMKM